MITIIDAHSHLNFSQFDDDRDEEIDAMKQDGIGTIAVGVDTETSKEVVKLARQYAHIWAVAGIHPTEAHAFDFEELNSLVANASVVGIGECGLDYYRKKDRVDSVKEKQKALFEKQIQLAIDHDLPLMLHCRPQDGSFDAYEDVLEILRGYNAQYGERLRGNVHFFVGNKEIAEPFLDMGFMLSFTGVVTFDRSLDSVVKYVPKDRYLVETDAPFAAPQPHRGARNTPRYISYIIEKVAEIRGESVDTVIHDTFQNTKRLFSLQE